MQELPANDLIYETAIGPAVERLAPPVRDFHRAPAPAHYAGRAIVVRGTGPLVAIIAAIIGLPRASPDCAVEIVVTRDASGTESWRRSFAGKPFVSSQEKGHGRWQGLIVERIGPMAFAYAVLEKGSELHLDLRGWSAFGLGLPLALGPRAIAFEHGDSDRFNFDVEIKLPILGRLVHYRGWLKLAGAPLVE